MTDGATGAGERPASDVVMARVAPGTGNASASLRAALETKAGEFPGFVGVEVFHPPPGVDEWTALVTFECDTDLQRWRASPERTSVLRDIHSVPRDQDWVLPSGFRQWSRGATSDAQPPVWKQAMTALAVLYAMVSVLNITLGNFIGNGLNFEGRKVVAGLGLPLPAVVFVGNAVGTVLLSWVLMPIVTRLLNWWLSPTATRAQTIRGAVLLVGVYLIEVWFFDWVFRSFGF